MITTRYQSIDDPEYRVAVQQEIAKRTSSDGCNRRDHDHPEEVQMPISRRKYTARGKHGHAGKVKVIQEHAPSYIAESGSEEAS
jgi:adenylate kinase